ncbi:MAG TPA: hypothetical protein VG942_19445 [Hyphomonadaceae bacterium]|nr:hypothetical protein [Hyphomonadaceae bacterium]
MTHLPLRRIAVPLLFVLIAAPAFAQAGSKAAPPDISGSWKFKTDVLPNKGCVISGNITFTRLPAANAYSCSFVSREDCNRANDKTFTEVKQSCTVALEKGQFKIDSKVDAIVDAGPPDFKSYMLETKSYTADSFVVSPNKKGELIGLFHSIRQCAVKFWRTVDLVS